MGRYAALLRGITPSNPKMTNDKLRGVLTGLGLESVASVLASGNLVFRADVPVPEAPDPRTRIVGYDRETAAFLAVVDNSEPGSTPDFMAWLERACGKDITTRTWLTVHRVVKKLDALT